MQTLETGSRGPLPGQGGIAAPSIQHVDVDGWRLSIPCAEIHLVVRIGPAARQGLDVHVLGGRQHVRRKFISGGQRMVALGFGLGDAEPLLGVPARELQGRVVALEDLWTGGSAGRLCDRLAGAGSAEQAAAIVQRDVAARFAAATPARPQVQLALAAAGRLATQSVDAVAAGLGVSSRHLRRVFLDAVGMSPKSFANLARFRRALRAARANPGDGWAAIAAEAGYYDQSHLIADFRAVAGVTPGALIDELRRAAAGTPGAAGPNSRR